MDSACSTTIVNSSEGITNLNLNSGQKFTLADQREINSQDTGLITGGGKNLKAHIIESFGENLLSIPQLFERNITVFHPTHGIMIADACDMSVTCAKPLGVGCFKNGTFLLDIVVSDNRNQSASKLITNNLYPISAVSPSTLVNPSLVLNTKAMLWLKRLAYSSPQRIVDAVHHNLLSGLNLPITIASSDFPITEDDTYMLSKSHAQPHRNLEMRKHSKHPYEMVHIDFKSVGETSWGGAIGMSTIVDDFSRRISCIVLKINHNS
jgi:hypothetical protein